MATIRTGASPAIASFQSSVTSWIAFYKEIDSTQQIEISPAGATWPIVNGQVELVAKVYSDNGTVSGVTYSVDNATAVAMTLATGSKWVTAKATWDTGALSQDYHKITVTATDNAGSFQTETEVKVSTETLLTIKDLQDHLRVYQGHYVTIQGTVETAMFNTSFAPAGAGGAVIVRLYRQGSDLCRRMLLSSSTHCCQETAHQGEGHPHAVHLGLHDLNGGPRGHFRHVHDAGGHGAGGSERG